MQVCRSQEAALQQVLNPPRALSLDVHRQRRLLKTADNVTWVERRAYYLFVSAACPPSSAPSPLLPRWLPLMTGGAAAQEFGHVALLEAEVLVGHEGDHEGEDPEEER